VAPLAAGLGVAAGAAMAVEDIMRVGNNILRTGNRFGLLPEDAGMPMLRYARDFANRAPGPVPGPTPSPLPQPVPKPVPEDQDKRNQRETINLDTGTIIGATSLRDPWLAIKINAFLWDKHAVVTREALAEWRSGNFHSAGPIERMLANVFLLQVDIIQNDPSKRVMRLKTKATNPKRVDNFETDKLIFGTGDNMGIRTATGDPSFKTLVKHLDASIDLNIWRHPPARYLEK
jgi:hypothetical protein